MINSNYWIVSLKLMKKEDSVFPSRAWWLRSVWRGLQTKCRQRKVDGCVDSWVLADKPPPKKI